MPRHTMCVKDKSELLSRSNERPAAWCNQSPAPVRLDHGDTTPKPVLEACPNALKNFASHRLVTLSNSPPQPLIAYVSRKLSGEVRVPGDKSISHRALILGAMAVGETVIEGLLEGEDVLATAEALKALGAHIRRDESGTWHIRGVGVGGFHSPDRPLDFGNSGTGVRLMMGAMASQPIEAELTGDASLCSRPMGRVITPLRQMGARFDGAKGERLPLTLKGARDALPIRYELPVASAQVKSAVLLAGLNAPGSTSVIEHAATRDHTERMLRAFGADVESASLEDGGTEISISGYAELEAQDVSVPADPSSAAFPLVAALITEGSEVVLRDVMLNETRTGLITTLREMGGDIETVDERSSSGERVADLHVRASQLHGVEVPPERAPSMIDEYPVLAVAAATAEGETRMRGLGELRVKESDRLAAVADGLSVCGVAHRIEGDDLIVSGGRVAGGGPVKTHMDHRIAMAFLVLGLASENGVHVDDGRMIATSFPTFQNMMQDLGCRISAAEGALS